MQKHLMSKWRSFFNAYICLLTCHRHVIHYRSLRFSFMIAKRKAPPWVLSFLVDPRRIDSRRLDARSVIAALTAVKGCHSLPLPSILLYDCKKKSTPLGAFLFGGPEENRTPVRKTIRGAFSERIPSFEIPSSQRRQTGSVFR